MTKHTDQHDDGPKAVHVEATTIGVVHAGPPPSYVGDQSAPDAPALAEARTAVRLLDRDRQGPGLLSLIVNTDFGFLINIRDVIYVHVSTDADGVWQFVPLNPN